MTEIDVLVSARIHALERDIAQVLKGKRDIAGLRPQHFDAITTLVSGMVKSAKDQDTGRKQLSRLSEAQEAWQLFRTVIIQHRSVEGGEQLKTLNCLEAVLQDGHSFLASLVGDDSSLPFPKAPPVVLLEAGPSPAFHRAHKKVRNRLLTADATFDLPIPIVSVPLDHVGNLWLCTTLLHELGHHVDRRGGISAELAEAISIGDSGYALEREEFWKAWAPELIADAFGLLMAGSPLLETMMHYERVLGPWQGLPPQGKHPPMLIRCHVLSSLMVEAGISVENAYHLGTHDCDDDEKQAFFEDCALVTPLLANQKLWGKSASFREVLRSSLPVMEALITKGSSFLCGNGGDSPDLPARLLPGVHQRAVSSNDCPSADIDSRVKQLRFSLPDWSPSKQALEWMVEEFNSMRAPILETIESRPFKRPPISLLTDHNVITFVGGTNGQLAQLIKRAFKARDGRPWARLEIYFLAEARLSELVSVDRALDQLVEEQRMAKRGFWKLFADEPKLAIEHDLREYETPFFFASFWDVETVESSSGPHPGDARKAWPRVHLSPNIWGTDIRNAPSFDFVDDGHSQTSYAFSRYSKVPGLLRDHSTHLRSPK